MPARTLGLLWIGILVGALGCGAGDFPVRGTVTWQGKPITDGEIIFTDPAGKAPAAVSPVSGGRFELRTTPGEKVVRITATEKTGKTLTGAMGAQIPETIDLLPAKFNTESTLRRTVEAKANEMDFRLDP